MKGADQEMGRFDPALFNEFLQKNLESPRVEINRLLRANHKNFQLSVGDIQLLNQERQQLFKDYHLVDFSWQNTQALADFLAKERIYYRRDYVEQLNVCQSIFYYLRSYHSSGVTDQEIIETIQQSYEVYHGDLEQLQGFFEDFPALEGEI
ncbi:DUF6323 family protein [Enterococcus sp. DIV0800]|uniref:DUF6323 family protein n=1 Tax=unclassified Enterococcus TaxID=2608891 RepID=UPI003D2FD47A